MPGPQKFTPWMKIPFLPKEWYEFMEFLRKEHEMSQWQFFILSTSLVQEMSSTDNNNLKKAIDKVKELYPSEYVAAKLKEKC
jgi:hypothetical protein